MVSVSVRPNFPASGSIRPLRSVRQLEDHPEATRQGGHPQSFRPSSRFGSGTSTSLPSQGHSQGHWILPKKHSDVGFAMFGVFPASHPLADFPVGRTRHAFFRETPGATPLAHEFGVE